MTRKAVGLHLNSGRAATMAAAYLDAARPTVMKWLSEAIGDGALVRASKARGALTVGRVYWPTQGLSASAQQAALDSIRAAILEYPDIEAWEGFNEAFQREPGEMGARSGFDVRLMELCEGHGKKAVIGSFSVGQPPLEAAVWAAYLPALRRAAEQGHFLGIHEYGGPAMQWGAGGNQVSELQGGQWVKHDPATRPGVDGWFVLRYRKVKALLRSLDLAVMPRVIVTETGLDDIQPRPEVGARTGFRSYAGTEWANHPVYGDLPRQLRWQSERWAEDPEIVGGVVFCHGDASGMWGMFDTADEPSFLQRLAEEMKQLPTSVAPKPEEPKVASLADMLEAALGPAFIDVRGKYDRDDGPNGPFGNRSMGSLDHLAIHHTVGPVDQTIEAIAQTHRNQRGFAGPGYHLLLREGVLWMVGDEKQARACCVNMNHRVLCLAVLGDYRTDRISATNWNVLRTTTGVIQKWSLATLRRRLIVAGHGQVPGQATECPGPNLRALLPELQKIGPVDGSGTQLPAIPADRDKLQANVALIQGSVGVQLNAAAALQRRIRADGLTPTTREGRWTSADGRKFAWQRAEALTGGGGRIYLCVDGDWGNVLWIPA